jgi:hypothetical protein|tara:strand:+ start:237 stop:458 length:222 start_codon:yes stop_codon:yes gene_type:complete
MAKESNIPGPYTLLRYPANLEEVTGKPTGQGFGAARKGPQVHGGPIEAVVDEDYPKGNTFATNTKDVKNIGVK